MKKILLTVAALMLVLGFVAVSQTPAAPKHHVVFQLTEPEGAAWNLLVLHVQNSREALAKDGGAEMEVVFFGPGLNMLKKTNTAYAERLQKLSEMGVRISACQNAMRMMNVKTEDMFPFVGQVDSGVAQLVRRQESGWAYIH